MAEGDELRILLDQITEGQVSWNLLDKDYDRVSMMCASLKDADNITIATVWNKEQKPWEGATRGRNEMTVA